MIDAACQGNGYGRRAVELLRMVPTATLEHVPREENTVADGLATALMVMGPRTGVALVDRLAGVEALVMVRQPDGALTDHPSSGFVIQ